MGANTKILIAAGSVSLTGSLVFAFLIAPGIRKETFEMDKALYSSMSSNKDKLPIYVLAVSGEVYYVPEGSTEKVRLTENSVVMEGSTIITGEGASVTIENENYFTGTIGAGSTVNIAKAKVSASKPVIELNLVAGTVSIISKVSDGQFIVKSGDHVISIGLGTSLISAKDGDITIMGEGSISGVKAAKKVVRVKAGAKTLDDRRQEEEQQFQDLERASITASARAMGKTERVQDTAEETRTILKFIKKIEAFLNDGKIAEALKFVEIPFYLNEEKLEQPIIVEYFNRFVTVHQKYAIKIMDDTIISIVKEDGTATSSMMGTFEAEEYEQSGEVTCVIQSKLKITVKLRKTGGLWVSDRLNIVYE